MNHNPSDNSLTPQKQALSLINYYFQKERQGDINATGSSPKKLFKII